MSSRSSRHPLTERRCLGEFPLGEFPLNVFRIGCERCGRAGSCRRGGLVKRFGGGIALPDLLVAIIAVAAVLATTATANAIHLRCDAPIVSFGPSDPGKDPVKTVDIERDGPKLPRGLPWHR